MKKNYSIKIEKLLFYIPFLMFLLYTNVHYLFAMQSNSKLISTLINTFNKIYMKGPYIFLGISIILAFYILINGNKLHKSIAIITGVGCFFMHYNLINAGGTINTLTELSFISSYLIGIFYT